MFLYLGLVKRSMVLNKSKTRSNGTIITATPAQAINVTRSSTTKLTGNSPLAKRTTVMALVGFITGFMVVFLLCRFIPDLAAKVSAKLER